MEERRIAEECCEVPVGKERQQTIYDLPDTTFLHLSPRVEIDMLVDGSATTASYMDSACQDGHAGCEGSLLLGS